MEEGNMCLLSRKTSNANNGSTTLLDALAELRLTIATYNEQIGFFCPNNFQRC